jgi:hypothetical protein
MNEMGSPRLTTMIDPKKLNPHPENIYNPDISDRFIEDVGENRLSKPIRYTDESQCSDRELLIISGHRRRKAAIEAGLSEVECIEIGPFDTEWEEIQELERHNDYRELNFREKMQVADRQWEMHKADNLPNLGSTKREARENIADRVHMGRENLRKARQDIWKPSQDGNERAEELVDEITDGETSIHAASEELKEIEEGEKFEEALNPIKEADLPDGWEFTEPTDSGLVFESEDVRKGLSVNYDPGSEEYVIPSDGTEERIENSGEAIESIQESLKNIEDSAGDPSSGTDKEDDGDDPDSSEGQETSPGEEKGTDGTDGFENPYEVAEDGTVELGEDFAGAQVRVERVEDD